MRNICNDYVLSPRDPVTNTSIRTQTDSIKVIKLGKLTINHVMESETFFTMKQYFKNKLCLLALYLKIHFVQEIQK